MPTNRAIIRYSFTETVEGGKQTTALITALISGTSEENALNYLIKKYPERNNIKITEIIINEN